MELSHDICENARTIKARMTTKLEHEWIAFASPIEVEVRANLLITTLDGALALVEIDGILTIREKLYRYHGR